MKKGFTQIESFINRVDVECPKCKSKALVTSNPENRQQTRFVCSSCGAAKDWKGNSSIYSNTNLDFVIGILTGQPVDCYFKLPLWYKTDVKGNILFAYNIEHLQFLENYVSDKIRERQPDEQGWSNRSLESRLPKWMLSSKNRGLLQKKIKELKKK
ncbi:MAG: hypothetical protein ABFS32_14325 [Bacteroidota bacterium]